MKFITPFGQLSIPLIYGNVGVTCSGGADSAILLYALVSSGIRPRVFYLKNANSSFDAARRVVDFIRERFRVELTLEPVERIYEGHAIRGEIVKISELVSCLYTGITKNPPVVVSDHGTPYRVKNENPKIIPPFEGVDKRVTIWLYSYFGVPDLLKLTHSCTADPVTPCNSCFACRERTWAVENQ